MLKKHVILFEAKDHGWIAYSTTFSDAKRMLAINASHQGIFYIFEFNLLKHASYKMNLTVPFPQHYNCSKINVYKEEDFDENDKYMTISYDDTNGSIKLDI